MRLIVGITRASGVVYGVRLLEILRKENVKTDLVLTDTAAKVIASELEIKLPDVLNLATQVHKIGNLLSPIASGGYPNQGMVVIPCSMKTIAGIACARATILPAMPAYYHKPDKVEDLVDHFVGKVLDVLGIKHELYRRWKGC